MESTPILESASDGDVARANRQIHPYILWFGISSALWALIGISIWLIFMTI